MTTVTCPRCLGFARAFERFAHVNEGRCLLCDGALVIERSKAAGWVAANPSAAPVDLRPSKLATVGGIAVRIERLADGSFELVTVSVEHGELRTGFEVRSGRVVNVQACNGHLRDFAGTASFKAGGLVIASLLQAALRA